MKKQYIFLILLLIILYLLYIIINYKYKEYKINTYIDNVKNIIENNKKEIEIDKIKLEYISTNSYKDKILKENQWLINEWEKVIFITNKDIYSNFTMKKEQNKFKMEVNKKNYDSMSIFEKWMYFLFKKDLR